MMNNLDEITEKIKIKLNEKDILREKTLKQCRDIIRDSRKSIKYIHQGNLSEAEKNINVTIEFLSKLKKQIKKHPDVSTAGYMENAMQELSEASIFLSIVHSEDIPSPEDIGVSYTSFLMGLADVVGELRRKGVNLLKDNNIEEVEKTLYIMERICDNLIEFDYPSGLLPIKRKQDVIKKILEKMRGELTLFKKSKELESKIDAIIGKLSNNKSKTDTVDIDSLL